MALNSNIYIYYIASLSLPLVRAKFGKVPVSASCSSDSLIVVAVSVPL
jgi:hypothetical protein